jgi:hypothetical protein
MSFSYCLSLIVLSIIMVVAQSTLPYVGAHVDRIVDESVVANQQPLLRGRVLTDEERYLQAESEFHTSKAAIPFLQNNSCVSTDRQIRDAIQLAPNPSTFKAKRLLINLCRPTITIDPTIKSNGVAGINLTDRLIDFRCKLKTPNTRCVLDGQGKSRIFYGNRTKVVWTGIDFLRATAPKDDPMLYGAALTFGGNSDIVLVQSFLRQHVGKQGSAIAMDRSTLTMRGSMKGIN